MNDYDAIGIAEGFVENPGKTDEERTKIEIAAWQHLIDTGPGLCHWRPALFRWLA